MAPNQKVTPKGHIRESELPLAEAFKAPASTRSQTIERGNP